MLTKTELNEPLRPKVEQGYLPLGFFFSAEGVW